MDVRALLSRIRDLPDLPQLIQAFGHRPEWQEFPPGVLPLPVPAVLAGRSGHLEWIAVRAQPAAPAAQHLAATLAHRGRLVGVLALDATARELAIGITVDRTAVATFPLDHPGPAQAERLRRLFALADTPSIGFALRALEILDGEDLGRRFFVAFQATQAQMAERLTGPVRASERHGLALLQLTRVLFLYFVQAKGWLDGRPDFLRETVDDALARRRRLHRDLFRPLFFGTLNRPPEERGRARLFGRIPFLNGGLFEPHPMERGWRGDIPNLAWREAFDGVFERFHFTVHEGADPGRIAPDMLGRLFEGLMAPADRRESGAFYTPAGLVARMVDAAIEALVAERFGLTPEAARSRLTTPDGDLVRLLERITILDPAVGSGAFLLGALERLAWHRRGAAPPAVLRRQILARNLFGVDLNPMAVRLAELRLWLAVIAAEETVVPEEVPPLPNLDGLVRQGDSLLDPSRVLAGLAARPEQRAEDLRAARQAFVATSGPEKRELLRRLRQMETAALAECLSHAEARLEGDITECLETARDPTLFGDRHGLDRDLVRRLAALRARLREIRRLARRVRREGGVPWFSYDVHFGDVLAQGGFDLIIGNPPWVRAEQLPQALRANLGQRYRWWRGAGRGFQHQPDLALAFVERSAELLAPAGVLAFLLPAKIATAEYARRMRGALAEQFTVHVLADLTSDPGAAFTATTTFPAALVAARRPPDPDHEVRLALDACATQRCQQQRFGAGPWLLLPVDILEALAAARGSHPSLGERFIPQLGVKTGANVLFLDPPGDIEPGLIREALRGRDIRPFQARSRLRLFFPHGPDGSPYRRLPVGAARFVQRHEALLRARVDYQGGPLWTLFRVRAALASHRVVWPDLARGLTAVALTPVHGGRLIPLNSCYVLPVPDRPTALTLAAWLNSTWLRVLARAAADVAAGGFARFNARVISTLPLPHTVFSDPRLPLLAERGAAGEAIQEELDAVAAEHLALTADRRATLARAPGADPHHRGRSAGRSHRSP